MKRKNLKVVKFQEKLTLLKIELSICHLVILNSCCFFFPNQSLKDLDYTNSYNKFKILLN